MFSCGLQDDGIAVQIIDGSLRVDGGKGAENGCLVVYFSRASIGFAGSRKTGLYDISFPALFVRHLYSDLDELD